MKRLITIFVAIAALLGAATKVNLIDIRPLASGPTIPYMVAFSPTAGWIPVIPDPAGSITLDTTGAVAILKSSGGGGASGIDVSDDFTMAGSALFTTTAAPRGIVDVYRNGVMQTITQDYTITGLFGSPKVIGMSNASPGDMIKLRYQK